MSAPRVFVDASAISGDLLTVTGDPYRHVAVVLRRRAGDCFIAIDAATGEEYIAEISTVSEAELTAQVIRKLDPRDNPGLRLTIYQGLPKGKRFPLVLQKCTELGAARIVPVMTARSVVRIEPGNAADKVARWSKITEEAARQSMRSIPPEVAVPVDFAAALADFEASGAFGIFLDEELAGRDEIRLADVLSNARSEVAIAAFVGPEGGFTPEESKAAAAAGLIPVGLGSRILRTETAAIAIAAIIMYEAGELG